MGEGSVSSGKLLTTAILMRDFVGRHFDPHRKRFTDIQVERGSLLRSISMTEDGEIARELKEIYRDGPSYKEPLFMKCLDVLLLSDSEAAILLAIRDNDIRYEFYRDSSRFSFIDQLAKGDSVIVEGSFPKQSRAFRVISLPVIGFACLTVDPSAFHKPEKYCLLFPSNFAFDFGNESLHKSPFSALVDLFSLSY
ncbi:unnamed protein product [Toxocara canis]|uniref:AAA_5 domain-containing protein n=1 Tax=Toxocara canis TaxID=6265 RepID=A0A183V5V6_TOXCA|nr:unnamed protein product [Toxocara canis]